MSFISLILWALVLLFIFKAIRFIWRGVGAYKQQRSAWEQFYRQATGQEPPRQKSRSKGSKEQTKPRRRRKIFTKDDGEYVEFEDIVVSETETTKTDNGTTKKRTTVTESQIVDAEWEDIP